MTDRGDRFVDLSHSIRDGMVTHPGIPEPRITTFLSHEGSVARYAPGTTFQIGRIDMVANTGTYLDAPGHRIPGAPDLGAIEADRLADLAGLVVDCRAAGAEGGDRAIGPNVFDRLEVLDRAVLVMTGWSRHWGAPAYLSDNPFFTGEAAQRLVDEGAALVGIDSVNVDSLVDPTRPAHTAILKAHIPLVEHLTGLDRLPVDGWRFFAVPPRIEGMATFPVRAFAILDR